MVSRTKESPHRAEQALRLFAPADALAGPERGLDQRLIFHHDGRQIEGALQIDWAVRFGKHHRLFRRQAELGGGWVVGEVAGRSLVGQPFASVALGDVRLCRQLASGHRAVGL